MVGLLASNVYAGSNGVYLGSNHSTGNTANKHSIFVSATNPAAASLAISSSKNARMNDFPAVWNITELGEVDSFIEDIDELIDILNDPANIEDSVEDVLDRFNKVLVEMGEKWVRRHRPRYNRTTIAILLWLRVNGYHSFRRIQL